MKLSMNVLSYNRDDIINRNIDNLINLKEYFECKNVFIDINVIDNFSTDNTRQLLTKYLSCEGVNITLNSENLGVSKGRNVALRNNDCDWHFILDDDSIISKEAIEEFLVFISDSAVSSNYGVVGLNILEKRNNILLSEKLNIKGSKVISNFGGGAFVINSSLYNKIGGMDELCTFGGEELDYSIRCIDSGYSLEFLESAVVEHFGKNYIGTDLSSRREKWLFNYTRVIFKHFHFPLCVIFAFRYFLVSYFSGLKVLGLFNSRCLFSAFLKGVVKGVASRKVISKRAMKYYSSKTMIPEYGNHSLIKKIKNKYVK